MSYDVNKPGSEKYQNWLEERPKLLNKWKFKIKGKNGQEDYWIEALFSDEEIKKMKEESPEIKWHG